MAPCPLCRGVIQLVVKMVGSIDCSICYENKSQNLCIVPCGHTLCVGCCEDYLDTFRHVTWHDLRNPDTLNDAIYGITNPEDRSTLPMTPPPRAAPQTPPAVRRPLRAADLPPRLPPAPIWQQPAAQFLGAPFSFLGTVVTWYMHPLFDQYTLVLENRQLAQPPFDTAPPFVPAGFSARWVVPNNRTNRRWVLDAWV